MNVFVLEHLRCDEVSEDAKLCGVFSTEDKANAAIARLSILPGFRDYPNGFSVDKYEIDEVCWAEGFGVPWPPD